MSLITKQDRISVRQFAPVPALVGLPEITRSAQPLSTSTSLQGPECELEVDLELEEGCMVTKLVKYTHRVVYFIKNTSKGDPVEVVSRLSARKCCLAAESPQENIIKDLDIVPFVNFALDQPCNLAFRKFECSQ
jgi:hypothetical protein